MSDTDKDTTPSAAPDAAAPPPVAENLSNPTLEDIVQQAPSAAGYYPALDSDGESVLSDIDDTIFDNFSEHLIAGEQIPIDEDTVHTIGKHKKKVDPKTAEEISRGKKKGGRRRDIKRRREDVEDERDREPEVVLTAAQKARIELDKKIDAATKGPKRRKRKDEGDDLEALNDDLIKDLNRRMKDAADRDCDSIENERPATQKLAMLDEVKELLNRPNLISIALDNQILEALRRWLEPLPNKSLPAYSIQRFVFELLAKMKPSVEYLRESGIGKVVMFYTRDSRPHQVVKREAERLVRDWSRPILGRSDDYHSREIPMAEMHDPRRKKLPLVLTDEPETADPLAPPQRNKNRTRMPVAMPRSYDIAPKSRLMQGVNTFARPIGAAGDDVIRRMMAKKGKGSGKSGMIIG